MRKSVSSTTISSNVSSWAVTPQRIRRGSNNNDSAVAASVTASIRHRRNQDVRSSTSRWSLMSGGRRSSFQEAMTGRKDYKLLTDKVTHQKNMKILIGFLTDHSFPNVLTGKSLTSPSYKEVVNIFEFIINFIISYRLENRKFEDEFPKVLHLIGFPYPLRKGQLMPVGSPHTWSTIVSALSWICCAAKYASSATDNPSQPQLADGEAQDEVVGKLVNQMHLNAYTKFMQGEDNYEEDDQIFYDNLPSVLGLRDTIDTHDHLERQLAEKEDELEEEKERERKLLEMDEAFRSDIDKLHSYLGELEICFNAMKMRCPALEAQEADLGRELSEASSELRSLKEVLKKQNFSLEERNATKSTIASLEMDIEKQLKLKEELNKEVVEKEVELLKAKQQLNCELEEYESRAHACKLLPQNASNAQGLVYLIRISKPESEASFANVDEICGRLKVIEKQWREATRESLSTEMKHIESIQNFENILIYKNEELSTAESQIRRYLEEIEITKQENAKATQAFSSEITVVEENIADLLKNKFPMEKIPELQSTVSQLQAKYQELSERRDRRLVEIKECLLRLCELIFEHKRAVEQRVHQFEAEVAVWYETMSSMATLEFDASHFDKLRLQIEKLHETHQAVMAQVEVKLQKV